MFSHLKTEKSNIEKVRISFLTKIYKSIFTPIVSFIHFIFFRIDSLYTYEILSPDPHFRLILVLPFSFTYARAQRKKGEQKRREMERKLRKEKWETKDLLPAT